MATNLQRVVQNQTNVNPNTAFFQPVGGSAGPAPPVGVLPARPILSTISFAPANGVIPAGGVGLTVKGNTVEAIDTISTLSVVDSAGTTQPIGLGSLYIANPSDVQCASIIQTPTSVKINANTTYIPTALNASTLTVSTLNGSRITDSAFMQGGFYLQVLTANSTLLVTLSTPYANNNYSVVLLPGQFQEPAGGTQAWVSTISPSTFEVHGGGREHFNFISAGPLFA